MRKIPFFGLILALAIPAAALAREAPPAADARGEVEAALRHYAEVLRTGPVDAVVASFTPEGELLEPGMAPLAGQEAIRAFLAPLAAAFVVESCEMNPESTEVFGNVAVEWGTYTQRAGAKGGKAADYGGRFAAEWRRDAGSPWRLRRLMMQPVETPK